MQARIHVLKKQLIENDISPIPSAAITTAAATANERPSAQEEEKKEE